MIDRIPFVIESHTIANGDTVRDLPEGEPLDPGIDLDAYLAANRTAGLVILQDGKVRLERYEMGFRPDGRWTSFSVAKSLTSTLVGAAVKETNRRQALSLYPVQLFALFCAQVPTRKVRRFVEPKLLPILYVCFKLIQVNPNAHFEET